MTMTQSHKPFTRLRDFIEPAVEEDIRKEVQRYKHWLSQQHARRFQTADQARYQNTYQGPVLIDGKETRLFAPFHEELSAHHRLVRPQSLFLVVLGLCVILLLGFLKLEAVTLALGLITIVYVVQLCVSSVTVLRELSQEESGQQRDPRVLDALVKSPWPLYTILCPLYKEAAIVPQFVKAIEALDYPKESLQVLFLTEEDDTATRDRIAHVLGGLEVESVHEEKRSGASRSAQNSSSSSPYTILTIPRGGPKTKPRACNYGLLHARGRYVVIYDAEDIPEPDQLKKAVLAFADGGPQLACVQAGLSFYNISQNILTRMFSIEYSTWFGLILPALARAGFALPLGGTSNHFQASCLRALGGWDAYNVTEDCDLGMRVAQYGFKTGILPSTTFEEANSRLGNWLRQRSRWIKGFMQTYLVHTRHPLRALKKKRTAAQLSLQLLIGGGSAVFLINPLMWAGLFIYMAFRSHVENIYHILFPTPILYLGMMCLIFGNFFYIYMCMLACARKEQYSLVPFCFLLPFYWLLMSVAGFKGLFQLFTRPHYWEKTTHGLHLGNVSPASGQVIDPVEAVRISAVHPIVSLSSDTTVELQNVQNRTTTRITTTERVRAIETLPMAVVKDKTTRKKGEKDYWMWATVVLASVCSIAATIYSFQHHDILLYADAYSHMRISRGLIDSLTPGLGQLGDSWLPLPHLLMLPFIWNDWLWETGIAGSIPSMLSYIFAACFLFLTLKKLTHRSSIGFIGSLIFLLNPDVIYLQTTPLTELLCIVAFTTSGYFFVTWVQEKHIKYLIYAALATFFTTIARYDGWILFGTFSALIFLLGIIKGKAFLQRNLIYLFLFIPPACYGILLWMVWNKMIFGDPLAFEHGPYSSHAQMATNYPAEMAIVTHNFFQSVRHYGFTVFATLGPILLTLALMGILAWITKKRNIAETLAVLSFLSPILFYIISFYTGQVTSLSPGDSSHLFNTRFGSQAVIPAALFIALLIERCLSFTQWKRGIALFFYVNFLLLIISASVISWQNGIVALEEGQYGDSCVGPEPVNFYLAQHYNGGLILEDTYLGSPNEAQELGIHLRQIVYQGSGVLWKNALHDPGKIADWVLVGKRGVDNPYPPQVDTGTFLFQTEFIVAMDTKDFELFQRRNITFIPNRPVPKNLLTEHLYCGTGKYPAKGAW